MKWNEKLFLSESVQGVEKKIIKKLNKRKPVKGYYLLILPTTGFGIMELVASEDIKHYDSVDCPAVVVGLAGTRAEAEHLAGVIVGGIYTETGSFDTVSYFEGE